MKYTFGSNYVPAEIVVSMKEEENNREVIVIMENDVYDSGNAIQEYNRKFKIFWPLDIYPCQKIGFFGAKMYTVPYFQVRGSQMIWVVSSLILHVEPLWNIISKSEMQRSEWQGYTMMYLTKHCLPFLNRRSVGIFKVLSITKLANIFESLTDIGKPFHHSLSFYLYHRLCTEFSNTCPKIFLLLLILFFTFIESILENVNDVLCLSFLYNKGDTYIFYNNDNDTIETFISFAVMEDKTIVDQKTIIISNIKSQIIYS